MKERTALIVKLLLSHILLLPGLISISVISPRLSIPICMLVQILLLIIFFTGYWEFFGTKFRIFYTFLVELIIIVLIFYNKPLHSSTYVGRITFSIFGVILTYLIFQLIKILIVIFVRDKNAIEIDFPLKNGKYLITDGGNSKVSRLMNYHFYSPIHRRKGTNNSMKFATDIVRIDSSKKTFFPLENYDYPIFGDKVYSPISGTIVKIENEIEDNMPYAGNYPYNTGNTIVIKNDNNYLLIGHLKKGSIKVNVGDLVNKNDLIAEAGNSGYSERPHIHMQLIKSRNENYWQGSGVSMKYLGKNLYKNRMILT